MPGPWGLENVSWALPGGTHTCMVRGGMVMPGISMLMVCCHVSPSGLSSANALPRVPRTDSKAALAAQTLIGFEMRIDIPLLRMKCVYVSAGNGEWRIHPQSCRLWGTAQEVVPRDAHCDSRAPGSIWARSALRCTARDHCVSAVWRGFLQAAVSGARRGTRDLRAPGTGRRAACPDTQALEHAGTAPAMAPATAVQ